MTRIDPEIAKTYQVSLQPHVVTVIDDMAMQYGCKAEDIIEVTMHAMVVHHDVRDYVTQLLGGHYSE